MKTTVVHVYESNLQYDVYIGRGRDPRTNAYPPFSWGNPFSHKENTAAKFKVASVEEAVEKFREFVLSRPDIVRRIKRDLKGRILGCWCKTVKAGGQAAPCHGDVLAQIADED